uniref:(northern house mosquito) hypothetical protein n=1 Tax=Culex pipiens TaxID=7175 RepID=A0A8D8EW44_CULPI
MLLIHCGRSASSFHTFMRFAQHSTKQAFVVFSDLLSFLCSFSLASREWRSEQAARRPSLLCSAHTTPFRCLSPADEFHLLGLLGFFFLMIFFCFCQCSGR